MCAATLKVLEILERSTALRDKVMENANYFRSEMAKRGFDLAGEGHPIIPVMLYDAPLAAKVADFMLGEGIYVTGFFYPVVPQGKARIRTQMSAAHTKEDIDRLVAAFVKAREVIGF
jgi:glycine C-acetyltransferase